jgi:hypothetical protein
LTLACCADDETTTRMVATNASAKMKRMRPPITAARSQMLSRVLSMVQQERPACTSGATPLRTVYVVKRWQRIQELA